MDDDFDVAILGGGPAGSTTGALLRRYNPALRVLILEQERFPREHVGESQLPAIGKILHEMGVWEDIEGAGFPIKIGASYTWGRTTEPWEFEFLPLSQIEQHRRPEPYAGWRQLTALQVDRASYDDILLRHADKLGCVVRQSTKVVDVYHDGDHVDAVKTSDGKKIRAQYYVDATGNAATLRRALGVPVDAPTALQNVAFWNYWDNVTMPIDRFGHGVTRVQIRSLTDGWIWFIPLSTTRASVGFVCPVDSYKQSKLRPSALYSDALNREPGISDLLKDAVADGPVRSTTDWSFLSSRAAGENWFLCGESLGFADPILAAGLTLTHGCAQHCAYTILEMFRAEHPRPWLLEQYEDLQRRRVLQHMRFAEYWYSANGCFSDLQEYCVKLAGGAGLDLSPAEAFQWLATGGFDDAIGQAVLGGFDLNGVRQVQYRLADRDARIDYLINDKSHFTLRLEHAEERMAPALRDGRIKAVPMYIRGEHRLVLTGLYQLVALAISKHSSASSLLPFMLQVLRQSVPAGEVDFTMQQALQVMELMAHDGWIACRKEPGEVVLNISVPREGELIYTSELRQRDAPSARI